ncbi:sigma 54-interacting transcriptional regulator [Thermodesulfobacterium hveragerdense]|uniref:sigma 54-interacting transcriptional regulator n=1 Tax=Thermodesulfobacterium hveragerdense TaxID=53424 RepID=UPI000491747D|nr:sigma 54-interacting transcriptional regulator [Thermodesulfobacterium hveragerdense]
MNNFKKPLSRGLFKIKPVKVVLKEFIDLPYLNTILGKLKKLYASKILLLLWGERGVGKSSIAKLIHHSVNKNYPLFYLDCLECSYKEEILKEVYFLQNQNGTIFLKNLEVFPEEFLRNLLKFILYNSQLKIIASSSTSKIQSDTIKTYFYIFQVLPLRERKEDISVFLLHFLNKFNRIYNKKISFHPLTIDILKEYHWPDNILEIQNLVERLVLLKNKKIYPRDIFGFLGLNFQQKLTKV